MVSTQLLRVKPMPTMEHMYRYTTVYTQAQIYIYIYRCVCEALSIHYHLASPRDLDEVASHHNFDWWKACGGCGSTAAEMAKLCTALASGLNGLQ